MLRTLPYHLRVGLILKGTGLKQLTAEEEKIHSAFARIKDQRPDLLPELDFVKLSFYPYSHQLHDALVLLQNERILSADNPHWEILRLDEERANQVEGGARKRDPEAAAALLALGRDIRDELAVTA